MATLVPPLPCIVVEILSLSQPLERYRKFKQAEKPRQAHGTRCSEKGLFVKTPK
jgi:hypothetical protein